MESVVSNKIHLQPTEMKEMWFKEFVEDVIPSMEAKKKIFTNNKNGFDANKFEEIYMHSFTFYTDWAYPHHLLQYCFNEITLQDARTISNYWLKFIEIKQKINNEKIKCIENIFDD